MSWDADLVAVCGCGHPHCGIDGALIGQWNYTHNTGTMIADALDRAGIERVPLPGSRWDQRRIDRQPTGPVSWWKVLDSRTGLDGARILHAAILELQADPARYQAMNPDNGWGSYETLLPLLREMRDASGEQPSVWKVSG